MDGRLQHAAQTKPLVSIPKFLEQHVDHMAQHAQIARHMRGGNLLYYLQHHFYCPPMRVGTYNVVENCTFEPLTYVETNISGLLIKLKKANTALLVIAGCRFKIYQTSALSHSHSAKNYRIHHQTLNFLYGLPKEFPKDSGKQFILLFLTDACRILEVVNQYRATYLLQINGVAE